MNSLKAEFYLAGSKKGRRRDIFVKQEIFVAGFEVEGHVVRNVGNL